jgi:hypothetical protein
MQEFERCFAVDASFRCFSGATGDCNRGDDPSLWDSNGSAASWARPPVVELTSDPFLPPRFAYGGSPGDLWTDYDNDTLRDDAERALAEAFRPYVVYAFGDILPADWHQELPVSSDCLYSGTCECTPLGDSSRCYPAWMPRSGSLGDYECASASGDGYEFCYPARPLHGSDAPRTGEPSVLFQVRPLRPGSDPLVSDVALTPTDRRIAIQYALLWHMDHGYPRHEWVNAHEGDDQTVTVVIRSRSGDAAQWEVESVSATGYPQHETWFDLRDVGPDGTAAGVHPVVFLSEGKHHFDRDTSCSPCELPGVSWDEEFRCPVPPWSYDPPLPAGPAEPPAEVLAAIHRAYQRAATEWHAEYRKLTTVVANEARDLTKERFCPWGYYGCAPENRRYDWQAERWRIKRLGNNVGEPPPRSYVVGLPSELTGDAFWRWGFNLGFLCTWDWDGALGEYVLHDCFEDEYSWDMREFWGGLCVDCDMDARDRDHSLPWDSYTSPLADLWLRYGISDVDGDGFPNAMDHCYLQYNLPSEPRRGRDYFPGLDLDLDTTIDACDNCPGIPNPDQADSDDDGLGDACDKCRYRASRDVTDTDGDGVGDLCDGCRLSSCLVAGRSCVREDRDFWYPFEDYDGDAVPDVCDNCVPADLPSTILLTTRIAITRNPDQANGDWRFEVQNAGAPVPAERAVRLRGDACDPEPLVGDSVWSGRTWNPRPEGAAGIGQYPASYEEVPFPGIGVPVESGAGWFVEEGEPLPDDDELTMRVRLRTSGFNQGSDEAVATPVELPVMLRRCACIRPTTGERIPLEECLQDYCPQNGLPNFNAEFVSGWYAATYETPLGTFANRDGAAAVPPGAEVPVRDVPFRKPGAGGERSEAVVEWLPLLETAPGHRDPERVPWVLWARPEPADIRLAGGGTGQERWPYVAKRSDGDWCSGPVDCDDYANAYSTRTRTAHRPGLLIPTPWEPEPPLLDIFTERAAPMLACPHCFDRVTDVVGPYLDSFGCPYAEAAANVPILNLVGPFDAVGDEYRFAPFDPGAELQGLVVAWSDLQTGVRRVMKTRMAPGEAPIDVVDFSLTFDATGTTKPFVPRVDDTAGTAPETDLQGYLVAAGLLSADQASRLQATAVPREAEFLLFGGRAADGTLGNRLFVGSLEPDPNLPPASDLPGGVVSDDVAEPDPLAGKVVVWREAVGAGTPPPGLVGAWIAPVAGGYVLVGGGVGDDAANIDLYRYTRAAGWWERIAPRGEPLPSSASAVTFRDETVYLYGGWEGFAAVDGLYRLNTASWVVERLDDETESGPGPRAQSSLVLSADGSRLFLFGGIDSGGSHNDLWRFDLPSGSWTRVAGDCLAGSCPPRQAAAGVFDGRSGEVAVVPTNAGQLRAQGAWFLREGRWVPGAAVRGDASAVDCDGDGAADVGVGRLCRSTSAWWAPVGRAVCDFVAGAAVCDAEAGNPSAELDRIPRLRAARFAVAEDGTLYALHQRQLTVYTPDARGRYKPDVPAALRGTGREVLLHQGVVYVATDDGLEVFSGVERGRPRRVWETSIPVGLDEVVASGNRLLAIGPYSFRVYDVSAPESPVELGRHLLIRALHGVWLLDPEWPVPDVVRLGTPCRRAAVFDGVRLLVADGRDLVALDLSDGQVLGEPRSVVLSGPAFGLRADGGLVYGVDGTDRSGVVVSVRPGALTGVGSFELESAVDNAVRQGSRAFRRTPTGVEVATLE